MEIIDNTTKLHKFDDLMVGAVFAYEGNYYIKTDVVNSYTTKQLYGVRLDTGEILKFIDTDNVEICSAKLYIE